MKKMINYFIEPYKQYDGNWKGLLYYEKLFIRIQIFEIIIILMFICLLLYFLFKFLL